MAKKEVKEKEESKPDQIETLLGDKAYKGLHLGSRSGNEVMSRDIITTSSLFMDQVLGGGFRSSSWSRFYGEPESGKTSQACVWARNWQDHYGEEGFVIYFNAEGRITPELLLRTGVNTDKGRFRIIDTNKADFIFDIMEKLILDNPEGYRYFFIVDSTDACQRTIDMDKTFAEADKIGGSATIQSAAGKRLHLYFDRFRHHMYMCSQLRDTMSTGGPGKASKGASGGNAPKFYSSLTGEIKKHWSDWAIFENPSDTKSKEIGRLVTIKLVKTYNETSGTLVQFPVKYGHKGGIWAEYEAMMACQAWNLVEKKGAHYSFVEVFAEELKGAGVEAEQKFHGERAMREHFDSNKDLSKYVLDKMRGLFLPSKD